MDYSQDALFDAYLDGTLPENERADFEAALAADDALRQEFGAHQNAREIVEIAALKATLGRIQQSVSNGAAGSDSSSAPVATKAQKGRVVPFYASRSWQAAAAVLLIAAGVATWRMTRPTTADKLYAKYYAPDAGLPGLMGSTTSYSLDDAMVDYKSGQYEDAVKKLKALREKGLAGDTVVYYLGVAYLANGQHETGVEVLHPLTQAESVFRKKAAWYEALALLRSGKMEAAKTALEGVAADSTNPRSATARTLLAEWPK